MAKKSKGKTAASTSPDPASSPPAATGTSTALASTSAKTDSLESSTGSIAASTSSSSSTQNGSAAKEVPAVDVVEDVDDSEELPDIQVNKWSLHDLKTACDDAVKQVSRYNTELQSRFIRSTVYLPAVLLQTIAIQAITCAHRRSPRPRMDSELNSNRSKSVRVQGAISRVEGLCDCSCGTIHAAQRSAGCVCQVHREGYYIRGQTKGLCREGEHERFRVTCTKADYLYILTVFLAAASSVRNASSENHIVVRTLHSNL